MNLWKFIFDLAKHDKSILHQLCGIKIFNKKLDQHGVISTINNEHIYVTFKDKPNCKYTYNEFSGLFDNQVIDYLPANLKTKLKTRGFLLKDPFITIFFKIEEGVNLKVEEIDFLLKRMEYELLGRYYDKNIAHDKWHIVNAAKYYRKARLVDKSLTLINIDHNQYAQFNQHKDYDKFIAAVLTIKGACLRDIGKIAKAEKCAWDALEYFESFHPYNLLGAIYTDKGKVKQGEDFFQRAEILGSQKKDDY